MKFLKSENRVEYYSGTLRKPGKLVATWVAGSGGKIESGGQKSPSIVTGTFSLSIKDMGKVDFWPDGNTKSIAAGSQNDPNLPGGWGGYRIRVEGAPGFKYLHGAAVFDSKGIPLTQGCIGVKEGATIYEIGNYNYRNPYEMFKSSGEKKIDIKVEK